MVGQIMPIWNDENFKLIISRKIRIINHGGLLWKDKPEKHCI